MHMQLTYNGIRYICKIYNLEIDMLHVIDTYIYMYNYLM